MRRTAPVAVAQLVAVRGVALGEAHSCARVDDGSVWCWGQNDVGELANGTTTDRATPGMIPGLFKVTDLRLGSRTTCALTEDNRIWCWGRNDRGQSGDGSEADRPVPVAVRFEAP
jgi:alpha-tubulin suppressor-like RCC1 family protein